MSSIKQKLILERRNINSQYYETVMESEANADLIGLDDEHLHEALKYVPNTVLKRWIREMKKQIKESENVHR